MRILCVFGEHNYGNQGRGKGYEYSNFIPSLKKLGHEIIFFDSWDRSYFKSFDELNRALLLTVERYSPDIIFSVQMHYEIWLETWECIRETGKITTINWATDDSWKYAQFSRFVAHAFDVFVTTCPDVYERYLQDGIRNVLLTQWAANTDNLNPPLPASICTDPVTFVGSAHGERRSWIVEILRQGIKVKCYGYGWPYGTIRSRDIPLKVRNSFISLNFANSPPQLNLLGKHHSAQIKARTFEVPGAGGFLLTEWSDGLEKYYVPGKEIAIFKGINDLICKVRYFQSHPAERDAIARAGYERTCREHVYEQRLAEILRFALAKRRAPIQNHPVVSSNINWEKFNTVALRHLVPPHLYLLKKIMEKGCSLLWGPVRGPRAARRLLFELSWRLFGSKTYSAAGLPGRFFYKSS